MSKTSQTDKYSVSLAGEFYVASQLFRRGLQASVTYGNAKSADVVAFTAEGSRALVIEVKSTTKEKWVVGSRVPDRSPKPWVFMYFPEVLAQPPEAYVLLQSELHDLLIKEQREYFKKYEEKHGVAYGDRPGVTNLARKLLLGHKDAWHKIEVALRVAG